MTDVFLEPRVLNYTGDKYELILLSLRWGRAQKAKGTPEPLQSLVEKALRDIVEGRVTKEEILSAHAPIPQPVEDDLPTAVSVVDDGPGEGKTLPLPADDEDDADAAKKAKKTKKKKDE